MAEVIAPRPTWPRLIYFTIRYLLPQFNSILNIDDIKAAKALQRSLSYFNIFLNSCRVIFEFVYRDQMLVRAGLAARSQDCRSSEQVYIDGA